MPIAIAFSDSKLITQSNSGNRDWSGLANMCIDNVASANALLDLGPETDTSESANLVSFNANGELNEIDDAAVINKITISLRGGRAADETAVYDGAQLIQGGLALGEIVSGTPVPIAPSVTSIDAVDPLWNLVWTGATIKAIDSGYRFRARILTEVPKQDNSITVQKARIQIDYTAPVARNLSIEFNGKPVPDLGTIDTQVFDSGSKASFTFTLRNTGGSDLTLDFANAVSLNVGTAYVISAAPANGTIIPAQGTEAVTISLIDNVTVGTRPTDTLVVQSDDADDPIYRVLFDAEVIGTEGPTDCPRWLWRDRSPDNRRVCRT